LGVAIPSNAKLAILGGPVSMAMVFFPLLLSMNHF
jgi:hypothetical protein